MIQLLLFPAINWILKAVLNTQGRRGFSSSFWIFGCLFWLVFVLFTFHSIYISPPFSAERYCKETRKPVTGFPFSQQNINSRTISCTGVLYTRGLQMLPLQQSRLLDSNSCLTAEHSQCHASWGAGMPLSSLVSDIFHG